MRAGTGAESTQHRGHGSPGSNGVHSVDGAGLGNGSNTKTQGVGPGAGGSHGGDEGGVPEKAWFAPVENEEISDCPGGVCPVPWLVKEERPEIKEDEVNHPPHYVDGGIECIEAIEAQLTPEEYRGYLKGNIAKYVWRERLKGGVTSLQKAQWYLDRLIQFDEAQNG